MTQPKPLMDREKAIQAAYQGHKSYTLMNTITAYDAPSVLSYSLNVEKGGFVSGFQAGADYQAKQDAAEIDRLRAEYESPLVFLVVAEIREIIGVGPKPMLSELPDALRKYLKGPNNG